MKSASSSGFLVLALALIVATMLLPAAPSFAIDIYRDMPPLLNNWDPATEIHIHSAVGGGYQTPGSHRLSLERPHHRAHDGGDGDFDGLDHFAGRRGNSRRRLHRQRR